MPVTATSRSARGVLERRCGGDGGRAPSVTHHEGRELRARGILDDRDAGAARDRIRQKVVPVMRRPTDSDEEGPGSGRPAVIADAGRAVGERTVHANEYAGPLQRLG